jgi:membrane-associated phospholipid phosphatase
MMLWYKITEIGGINLLGPLALMIAVWLLLERRWRLAWIWCWLYGGGMTLVLATKVAFIGWGYGIQTLDFTGLSGHSMRAMCSLPVLGWLLFYRAGNLWRNLAGVLGLVAGGLISYSRLVVNAHSVSEVLAGGALGLGLAAWFVVLVGERQRFAWNHWLAMVSLLGFVSSPYVPSAPTHSLLVRLTLQLTGHPRPFVREGWRYDPYYSSQKILNRCLYAKMAILD